jgi:hypothetical protein
LSADILIRELDWYLRDHFFRQSNTGKVTFRRESLPTEMASFYLRYRGADLQQLSYSMTLVLEDLVARKVLEQNGNDIRLLSKLSRLRCANTKCFYVNYLAESEPRICIRCQHDELYDFPKKKA